MRKFVKPILIFLAAVGITMAGLQVMAAVTSFRALPVTSDLMEPAVPSGSLLFMAKTSEGDLHVGDIIAVEQPNQLSFGVGRLIESKAATDGYYTLSFKGDNRALPEVFPYTVKDSTYVDKFSLPVLGYIVAALSSPFAFVILSAAALFCAWFYLFKMHARRERERGQRFVRLSAYRDLVAQERETARQDHHGLEVFFPGVWDEYDNPGEYDDAEYDTETPDEQPYEEPNTETTESHR